MLERMLKNGVDRAEFLLSFTRTSPVVVTCGPAGLNGSVKMVGVIPKEKYVSEILEKLKHAPADQRVLLRFLMNNVYVEEKVDFSRIGGLEIGFGHSWKNIRANGMATLVYFTPPVTSYEVRCDVEIAQKGAYYEFLNIMHNLYHGNREDGCYPAYIFKVREIYDNSATPEGYGELIYRRE